MPKSLREEEEGGFAQSQQLETPRAGRKTATSPTISLSAPDVGELSRRREAEARLLAADGDDETAMGDERPRSGLPPSASSSFLLGRTVGAWVSRATTSLAASAGGGRSTGKSVPRRLRTTTTIPATGGEIAFIDATDSVCSYPDCIQRLNIAVSRFHCRRCNGWYCALHAGHPSLGMKLDPHTGEPSGAASAAWSRICARCFHERYYEQRAASLHLVQDLTEEFVKRRDQQLATMLAQSARLCRRRERLEAYDGRVSLKVYQRQVVCWEEDSLVDECRICGAPFSPLNRRHHCRLCGRIICAEPSCSRFANLGSLHDVRICPECGDLAIQVPQQRQWLQGIRADPLCRLYAEMQQVRRQLEGVMPRFNEQLVKFEAELDRADPREEALLAIRHEAVAARDTAMLLFRHFDQVRRTIRSLPGEQRETGDSGGDSSETLFTLCTNIDRYAVRFLQDNMFTLRLLPRLDLAALRQRRGSDNPSITPGEGGPTHATETSSASSSLVPRLWRFLRSGSSGSEAPADATMRSALAIPPPANLTAIREKTAVLEEQRGQLEGFLAEAVKGQRFDEVRAIRMALQDLHQELARLNRILATVDGL